jgi:hypothetical protein
MVMEAIGPFGDVADATKSVGEPTVAPFTGALVETPAKLSAGTVRHSRNRELILINGLSFKMKSRKSKPERAGPLMCDGTEASTLVK